MLIDLVLQEGRITGALALDIRKGEFIRIAAKAVVMATRGWHNAFWPNTGMRDLSGQGLVVAHRAGAELGNLEFITFCCNVLLAPSMWRGSLASQENVHRIEGDGTAGHGNLHYTAARRHALSGHDEENDGSSFGHRRSSMKRKSQGNVWEENHRARLSAGSFRRQGTALRSVRGPL